MRSYRSLILTIVCLALLVSSAFAYQVCITPPFASVHPDSSRQFIAALRNNQGQVIPGLTWTWSVTPPTLGTITNLGLFTAGPDTGFGFVHASTVFQSVQYQGQAAVAVVLGGPPPPPPPPPPPGGIMGLVLGGTQGNLQPLPGARVTALPQGQGIPRFMMTNPQGVYEFQHLAPGTYLVRAEKPGYQPRYYPSSPTPQGATPIIVDSLMVDSVDVILPPMQQPQVGSIAGDVTDDSTGAPITTGWVRAAPIGPGFPRQVPINPQGHYLIANLPTGNYRVQCWAPAYLMEWFENAPTWQQADTVVVLANQQTEIDFHLVHMRDAYSCGTTCEMSEDYVASEPQASHFPILGATPNPFNPTTVLRYELRDASFVKLGIYDISGRLVIEVANGLREAGSHQITFDGSGLPSGIYFAKLDAGDYSQVQKMVLLK